MARPYREEPAAVARSGREELATVARPGRTPVVEEVGAGEQESITSHKASTQCQPNQTIYKTKEV